MQVGGGEVSEKRTFTIKSCNFPIQPAYKGGGGLILVIFVRMYFVDGPLVGVDEKYIDKYIDEQVNTEFSLYKKRARPNEGVK